MEPPLRRRRLVAGQVEDPEIDGRHGHARLFTGTEAAELDGHGEACAGAHLLRRAELDAERSRTLVDGQPRHADGAARHALRLFVHGTIEHGRSVGAGTPGAFDWKSNLAPTGGQLHLTTGQQAVT